MLSHPPLSLIIPYLPSISVKHLFIMTILVITIHELTGLEIFLTNENKRNDFVMNVEIVENLSC